MLGVGVWGVQSGRLEGPVEQLTNWAGRAGVTGMLAMAALMLPWVVVLLPAFLLSMAAGVVWGPWLGAVVVHVPQVLGMTLAFVCGRYLFRDMVEARVGHDPRFEAIDRAVADQGFWLVFLLRLSPVVPYNVLNYALGLTSIRLGPYFLASLIGSLPSTVMYTYLGATVGRVARHGEPTGTEAAIWWLGLAATVVLTVAIGRLANQAVRKALDEHAAPDSRAEPDK